MSLPRHCRVEFANGTYLVLPGTLDELRERHISPIDGTWAEANSWVVVDLTSSQRALFRPMDIRQIWELGV